MVYNIGCSGYNYKEWKGLFYPPQMPTSQWLDYYCQHFDTIEINASFYRFPTVSSLKKWYDKTPLPFRFCIKAHKSITHFKKFKDVEEELSAFYDAAMAGLRDKLECVLFQLPPGIKYNRETLDNIIRQLNPKVKNVVEFRHPSWWQEDVFVSLSQANIGFCIASYPGMPDKFVKTTDFIYMRLHGVPELYKSPYTEEELQRWLRQINSSDASQAFIYFDNTWYGHAIANAKFAIRRSNTLQEEEMHGTDFWLQ